MTQDNPPTQTKLMICGSRHHVSDEMVLYAKRCALRAYNNGWLIYTGDAIGIDAVVAKLISQFMLIDHSELIIAGLAKTPRHSISGIRISYVQVPAITYTERDRFLVENSDKVMCIWNGQSKSSGTYLNYLYACELGKTAWLVNSEGRITESNE